MQLRDQIRQYQFALLQHGGELHLSKIGVAVAVITGSCLSANSAPLTIELLRGSSVKGEPAVILTIDPASPDAEKSGTSKSVTVVVGSHATIDLAPALYEVQVRADDYWSARHSIFLPEAGTTTPITVHATTLITGKFVAQGSGIAAPEKARVRFRSTADETDAIVGESDCAVLGWKWRCRVPRSRLDLAIKAPGLISHYWWDLNTSSDLDLGIVDLRAGASLTGKLLLPGKYQDAMRDVLIALRPQVAVPAGAQNAARMAARRIVTRANKKGFFQFDGVAPGEYSVEAFLSGLTSRAQTVRVITNVETDMRYPLVMEEPHAISFSVTPAVDAENKPWVVQLLRNSEPRGRSLLVRQTSIAESGFWSVNGLPSGSYTVRVRSIAGEAWLTRDFELPGEPSPIDLKVAHMELTGIVKLGRDPLKAELLIGGENRTPSIHAESDEKGEFRAAIPPPLDDTIAEIAVFAEKPRVHATLHNIRVEYSDRGGAHVAITLPASVLLGEVVDENGKFVSHAMVNIASANGDFLQVPVKDDGSFDVYGLPPGPARVTAIADQSRQSDPVEVVIETDVNALQDIRLVVKSSRILTGRVMSSAGPVPGAVVHAFPLSGRGHISVREATGADGRYKQSLPAGEKVADVFVFSPGFATRMFRHVLSEGDFDIPVAQSSGSLVIEMKKSAKELVDQSLPTLSHAGSTANVRMFLGVSGRLEPTANDGLRITLVDLEPGDYSICASAGTCVALTLAPYTTASVRLPE